MDLNDLTLNTIHDCNGIRFKVVSRLDEQHKIFIEFEATADVNLEDE